MKEKTQNEKTQNEKTRRTLIGGQALMEGVMMRGKTSMAMAVREPGGKILLETERLKGARWYNKVPLIRGVVSFVSSLVTGMNTLIKSAEVSSPEEETPGKGWMAFAVIIGVLLAIGLFIVLPSVLGMLLFEKAIPLTKYTGVKTALLLTSLFEGILRIIIFVLYLLIVSRMKDIRRTFMYHGAEHRTINCYEKGQELTVENVQKCSTRHNRCGTTFLFFVMVVSILVFALVTWLLSFFSWGTNRWVRMAARLILLPLIAGISYELLRGLALLPDNKFTNALRAPGLALQRLTTYPPDDDMAEVAIKSFNAVLEMDNDSSIEPVKFGEHTFFEVKKELITALSEYGLDGREAESETDWILCKALGRKRGELCSVKKIYKSDYAAICDMLNKRLGGSPLDYVLGESEFYGNKIKVNSSVLVPRMETEILCEAAIKEIGERELKVLDMCTGSGCVALTVAKATRASVVATDISEPALTVARENLNGLAEVRFGDLFSACPERFDVILCNPPYISAADMENLSAEVKAQPKIALYGGEDGLDFYRRIAAEYKEHLTENGVLMCEIGYNQAADVLKIFGGGSIIKDLDDNDRVIVVKN